MRFAESLRSEPLRDAHMTTVGVSGMEDRFHDMYQDLPAIPSISSVSRGSARIKPWLITAIGIPERSAWSAKRSPGTPYQPCTSVPGYPTSPDQRDEPLPPISAGIRPGIQGEDSGTSVASTRSRGGTRNVEHAAERLSGDDGPQNCRSL